MLGRVAGWLLPSSSSSSSSSGGKKRRRQEYEEEEEEDATTTVWCDHLPVPIIPAAQAQHQAQQQQQQPQPSPTRYMDAATDTKGMEDDEEEAEDNNKRSSRRSSSDSTNSTNSSNSSFADIDLASSPAPAEEDKPKDKDKDNNVRRNPFSNVLAAAAAAPAPSPPPPSYFSFLEHQRKSQEATTMALVSSAFSAQPTTNTSSSSHTSSSSSMAPLLKRSRHNQYRAPENEGIEYLGVPPKGGLYQDVYADFDDIFAVVDNKKHSGNNDKNNNEDETTATATDTQIEEDVKKEEGDDDARSTCSSPLFPSPSRRNGNQEEKTDGEKTIEFAAPNMRYPPFSPSPVNGGGMMASPPRDASASAAASSSSSSSSSSFRLTPPPTTYNFVNEVAFRALVWPEVLGFDERALQRKSNTTFLDTHTHAHTQKEAAEEEENNFLFGKPAAPMVVPRETLEGMPSIWERVEPLSDCKIEITENGACVVAGPDAQTGVPSLFGIESETYWSMNEMATINLYRSLDYIQGKSLLLLAKRATRPSWAPQRLEVCVMIVDTRVEENGGSMLEMLGPAHQKGPEKGGVLASKLQVYEGREELSKCGELPDLLELVERSGRRWQKKRKHD